MADQSAKKKRIGSRRRVIHQNKTSEADETSVSSVAQEHAPEESAESVNVVANPDNASENLRSPELLGNRRKQGSSRRNKGQNVQSLATEPLDKTREEVEQKGGGNESTVQPERQEELSQAIYNSSLYLVSTPDYSEVHMSEADLERLVPITEYLSTDQEENYNNCKVVSASHNLMDTMLQDVDKSDPLQGEEFKENAHLGSESDLSILSVGTCPTVDQQPIDQSNTTKMPEDELFNMHSEKESKEMSEHTELLRQDGNVQGAHLLSESNVESVVTPFSSAPEITTDETSLREQTDIECSVEQAQLPTPREELSTNEEQEESVNSLEDKDTQHLEDNVNKVHDQEIRTIQMHKMVHFSESVIPDSKENSEIASDCNSTADEQLISLINPTETPGEELSNEYSATDNETKEIDSDTELLRKDGNSQGNILVSDLHLKSPDTESSNTVDTTTEKGSPKDYPQPEYSVDQAIFLSPKEELPTNEEQNEMFDINVQNSDDVSKKVLEQELNLSYTNEPQISDTDRVDMTMGQESEGEGQVGDDIKPNNEQTVHQEKEGIVSEVEDDESSLQTLQSEIHASLDSQPQDIKQAHTGSNSTRRTRKFGSRRANKLEQQVKDSVTESYREHKEDFKVEVPDTSDGVRLGQIDKSDALQSQEVIWAHHSGDVVNKAQEQELLPSQMQETPQMDEFSESVIHDSVGNSEIISGHLIDSTAQVTDTHQPQLMVESSDDPAANQEAEEYEGEGRVADDMKPSAVQSVHQEKGGIPSEFEEGESSVQTMKSEIHTPVNSQTEQSDSDFNLIGNRRKLGSSRKKKAREHGLKDVKDCAETYCEPKESEESTRDDEARETTQMLMATDTMWSEELTEEAHLKPSEEIKSTINDKENTPKMPEEDTVLLEDGAVVTADINSSSSKDGSVQSNKDDEEEKKQSNEPEDLHQFTGYDTLEMASIQSAEVSDWKDGSHIENISYHDDNIPAMSITADVDEQEEAFYVQNAEGLSYDKDPLKSQEISMQMETDAKDTVGDVTTKDVNTGAEASLGVQVSGQDEVGEKLQDSTKKDHEARETNASQSDPFSASHNKNDSLALCETGREENFRAEQATDVTEESGLSTAVAACTTQHGMQDSEDLQEKSTQKRRKIGSTRRTLGSKPEGRVDNKDEREESVLSIEADVRKLEKMEKVEELSMIVTSEVSQDENARTSQSLWVEGQLKTSETSGDDNQQQSCTSDLQSNMSETDELKALPPEQSASRREEVVNPVKFVQVTDEPLNTEDATKKGSSESLHEIKMGTENDEEKPESANAIQDRGLKSDDAPVVVAADLEIVKSAIRGGAGEGYENAQDSLQEPNDVDEVGKNLEMKSASPNLNSPSRRRKMGSTRRSLASRTKGEDLHQKQGVDNDATETTANVGDVKTECLSGTNENELQPYTERSHSESQRGKEKVFETVEYSHTGQTHSKPPAFQTFEESPVSHGQLRETEPQLTPNYLPAIPHTPPKHDLISESASAGRRRKMGSHRKSRGHQNNEDQTERADKITETQKETDVASITDESTTRTTEEESLGLDKISEVDESDKKPSSNISSSVTGKHSRPKSEKTPKPVTAVQHPYADVRPRQQSSQKTFSLGETSRGADLGSNSYNVLMVGDSSVGKTSFIKRAQSGKFSLDLEASIGLDSSTWAVVVDGKRVVLQLWDTAGQERFHSLTRQIFHKAQAFLLMYDITSSQSFSAVSYWASCIQEGAPEDVTILLLGNKSDHAERQVKTEQGEVLAKEYNFTFMECSAATGENVVESLETVARILSQKDDTREEVTLLFKGPQQRKSSGCC